MVQSLMGTLQMVWTWKMACLMKAATACKTWRTVWSLRNGETLKAASQMET